MQLGKLHRATFRFCLGLALLIPASCSQDQPTEFEPGSAEAPVVLQAWGHSGREGERKAIESTVRQFNQDNPDIRIEFTFLPEGSYNDQVQAAALAGDLPDVLEFDGPFVYNYVWQGQLMALDDLLSSDVKENLIPSILAQGTYRGHLYSLGQFDSGLALFGRKSLLEQAGVRIPATPEDAWSLEEFDAALAALAEHDSAGHVLDLKLNYQGEWFTYAFSPAIQSAGGDLIDRSDYQSASGMFNSPESVRAMQAIQNWINQGRYVDPNLDDHAFLGGRVALSWVGHWEYGRYSEHFPDDLVLIPLPDFGQGTRTGQGSWNWGITRKCQHPKAAIRFLEFLLEDESILRMTSENAAIPATYSAIRKSALHQEGGPLALYVQQLTDGFAVPRPRTPAYPVITDVFQRAFDNIRNGADVQTSLDRATNEIDQDIRDNQGYPSVSKK